MPTTETKNSFLDIFQIWKSELKKTFKDEGVILFFVIVPLLYPLLYSLLYTPEVVREIPIAVIDHSRSSLSREYLRKLDATPDVDISYRCGSLDEAQKLMKEEKIYGIVSIPDDFSKNITNAEKQTFVSVFSDMGSLLYYKGLLIANTDVSLEMNKEIKIQRMGNKTQRQEEIDSYPVAYEHINLFNPQNGFAAFLIPAVLVMILHQTLILGVSLRAGTEREHNRFHDLVSVNKYSTGALQIVFGKALAYFMIYLLNTAYVLFIVPAIFGLPQIGHAIDILCFLFPFLTATVFFAMTFSVFVQNRETSIIIFVFTSIPLLFISGISWPSTAIPSFWKAISYLFPSTLGVNGFVRLNSMGARLHQVSFEYIGLWIQALVYLCTTIFVYRRELLRSKYHIHNRLEDLKSGK
ncbi:MAG: ABC transporter permease [Flavobacteriaceae bacterium]|nr:ABC transporter permease [Flavobacteriaceae bacterium]